MPDRKSGPGGVARHGAAPEHGAINGGTLVNQTAAPVLRVGVLGAANIARQFITGVKGSPLVSVACVASRDEAKARAFAAETGVARSCGSYEALLADDGIDAIYNPLPNGLHAEWSIRAAEAGKHVLCEKPLAVTEAEAQAMFDAARRHGVILREAYPYMAQPQTVTLRRLLGEGAIGQVQFVQASIGFTLATGPNVRLERDLGGGAVLDAGSYPVSLVRIAVGQRPTRVSAAARFYEPEVDRTLMATLEFPGGALAQIACSFTSGNHRHAVIAGDGGVLMTTFLNHDRAGPPVLQVKRGNAGTTPNEVMELEAGDGFRLEAESFARLVTGDEAAWTGASPAESIDIMATIEAIRISAHTNGAWVALS
jgi:D-xylose 1-dehydrogenase (NADP+, D-xylono-1,5-lactone-forming)